MDYLKETNLVVHSNAFAPAIDKKITVVEQRMFAIYLSKLNPSDPDTREVSFRLEDYERIMGLQRFNITQLKECARKIISIPVVLDDLDGGFTACPLFSRFKIKKVSGEWMVLIQCCDDVIEYLFNLQKEFVKYALWNILNLTERNHQQMYRILKQYERIGEKMVVLQTLKFCLGVDDKYEKFYDFRRDVLEPCQKALADKTDIRFEYEPIRKGRKVHAIKFTIHKNTPSADKPLLSEFVAEMANDNMISLDQNEAPNSLGVGFQLSAGGQAQTYTDPNVIFFAEACNNEFSEAEMNRLIDVLRRKITKKSDAYDGIEFDRFHVLQTAYLEMCARPKVYNRVSYLLKILEAKEDSAT